jgi:hypothetical protein
VVERFTPEVLGMTASKGLAVLVFEIAILKLGYYLLGASTVPVLDITAYCAYKYVG